MACQSQVHLHFFQLFSKKKLLHQEQQRGTHGAWVLESNLPYGMNVDGCDDQ